MGQQWLSGHTPYPAWQKLWALGTRWASRNFVPKITAVGSIGWLCSSITPKRSVKWVKLVKEKVWFDHETLRGAALTSTMRQETRAKQKKSVLIMIWYEMVGLKRQKERNRSLYIPWIHASIDDIFSIQIHLCTKMEITDSPVDWLKKEPGWTRLLSRCLGIKFESAERSGLGSGLFLPSWTGWVVQSSANTSIWDDNNKWPFQCYGTKSR